MWFGSETEAGIGVPEGVFLLLRWRCDDDGPRLEVRGVSEEEEYR